MRRPERLSLPSDKERFGLTHCATPGTVVCHRCVLVLANRWSGSASKSPTVPHQLEYLLNTCLSSGDLLSDRDLLMLSQSNKCLFAPFSRSSVVSLAFKCLNLPFLQIPGLNRSPCPLRNPWLELSEPPPGPESPRRASRNCTMRRITWQPISKRQLGSRKQRRRARYTTMIWERERTQRDSLDRLGRGIGVRKVEELREVMRSGIRMLMRSVSAAVTGG